MKNVQIFIISRNKYIYFLFRLFLFGLIVWILDGSIGKMLEYFYFKQKSGVLFRTTYSIEQTKAELLIFGTSRANHDYRPDIFGKRLMLSAYNVGRDANYIFYHYAVLSAILKRYTPKVIILDFINGEFKSDRESYDRLQSLLPYYTRHPEMRSIIELRGPYEKIKLLSRIYPYNSSIFTIAAGNAQFNKRRSDDIQGYVPLNKVWAEPIRTADKAWTTYSVDSAKINVYEAFIQDCLRLHVKLYIVCSPYFVKTQKVDYSIVTGKEIARKYNIPFFDYSTDTAFLVRRDIFADEFHLNDEGAQIFSNLLIDQMMGISNK
jgi:hypothetical protein